MPARPTTPRHEHSTPLPSWVGPYQLFDHLGRGGMAEVFLARAPDKTGPQSLLVIKKILPQLAEHESFRRLLAAEAKIAAQLRHPNLVPVREMGRDGSELFLAMDYVEGLDLNQMLGRLSRSRGGLPAPLAMFIVVELLRALDWAHRSAPVGFEHRGIAHRDVSPSNVLVSFAGEIKLCDFGVARVLGGGELWGRDFADQVAAGKRGYMSPEQARGEETDARADLYSAAIILWELCAGRRLRRGTRQDMIAQAQSASVPQLPDREMPEHEVLQALLVRALAPQLDDRFQSAAEMLEALKSYVQAAGLAASPAELKAFMGGHFAQEVLRRRRDREKVARALERGPAVVLDPVHAADDPAVSPRWQDELFPQERVPAAPEAAPSGATVRDAPPPAPAFGSAEVSDRPSWLRRWGAERLVRWLSRRLGRA